MNFEPVELTPEQLAFAAEAEEFLRASWHPDEHLASLISLEHDRLPEDFAEVLADRGWIRPGAPREEGGAGLDTVETRLLRELFEELGIPLSNSSDLLTSTIQKYASERVRREVLPDILRGTRTVCLGYSEPDSGSDMAAARISAVRDGDTWVINGSKIFTTYAHESHYVFLLARTGPVEEKHRTLTTFLVPLDSPGIEVDAIWAMGDVRTNVTYYSDVHLSDEYRLGPVNEGWRVVSEPLAVEHGIEGDLDALAPINGSMGAEFCRTLEGAIDVAIEWAATTRGDDGAPLIQDPLVRSALSEALLDLEIARNAPGETGKVVAAEALIRQSDALVDLAGPAGFLTAGTPGASRRGYLSWSRLHAPGTAIYGGTSEIYRNNIAKGELGLPRPY